MTHDDGSGPELTPGRARFPQAIEGWLFVPDDDPSLSHFRPDPGHPLHPYNQELRRRPRLRTALDASPDLAAIVAERRDAVRDRLATYEAAGQGRAPRHVKAEAERWLDNLLAELRTVAVTAAPPGVDAWIALYYLINELIPARLLARALVPLEPVVLWVLTDGTLFLRFTSASRSERARYGPLIDRAQHAFGYTKDSGGQRAITDDPARNAEARTVAKLVWMGLSTAEVCAFMSWPPGRAREKRVADYLAAGDQLLGEDDANWPEERSVPQVRLPHRRNLGPPWGVTRL